MVRKWEHGRLSFPSKNNLVTGIRNSGGGGGGGEQSNMVAHYTMDNVEGGMEADLGMIDNSMNLKVSIEQSIKAAEESQSILVVIERQLAPETRTELDIKVTVDSP